MKCTGYNVYYMLNGTEEFVGYAKTLRLARALAARGGRSVDAPDKTGEVKAEDLIIWYRKNTAIVPIYDMSCRMR